MPFSSVADPTANTIVLSDFEQQVYERQIQLPTLGRAGQERLKRATVMISRVGGLGGTVATMLARAGVGRLVLAHDGVVEPENLNRMLLAFHQDVGRPRIDVFCETLKRINPELELVATSENVHNGNAQELIAQADLVVDGAPLFEERYAMNREAVRQRKPLIMAAMFGLEGYVTTILPGRTPCLACIYPEPPENWDLRIFPVIAPTSALVATIAAMEAIKLLTGTGQLLTSCLLYCELEGMQFRRFKVQRRAACPICRDVTAGEEL